MRHLAIVVVLANAALLTLASPSNAIDWNRRADSIQVSPPGSNSEGEWVVQCTYSAGNFIDLSPGENLDTQIRLFVNDAPVDSVIANIQPIDPTGCCVFGCIGPNRTCMNLGDNNCFCVISDTQTWRYAAPHFNFGDIFRFEVFAAPGSVPEQLTDDDQISGSASGVGDEPLQAGGDYVRIASENPATSASIRIQFATAKAEPIEVAVYDMAGRRVKEIVALSEFAGPDEVVWDSTDERGRRLPSGVYYVQMTGGQQLASARLVLLR